MIPLVTLADLIANHDLTDLGPATPEEIAALKPWDILDPQPAVPEPAVVLPAWNPPKVSPRNATLLEDARNRHLELALEIKQLGLAQEAESVAAPEEDSDIEW